MTMRKNSKGFTMIELLGALIIIGVLLLIAVPGVSTLMRRFREDYYVKLEKSLEASAKDFYADNKLYQPEGELKSSYTSIDSLIKKKYVEKLVDYKSKACSLTETESYVISIYKGNGKYEYKACISCPEDDYRSNQDKTYCDPAWRTNDNIKYGFGTQGEDAVYIYYGTSKDEVRKKLLKGLSVIKTNNKNEVLEEFALPTSDKDSILPNDIDKLDTSPILDSTNTKETILHYNRGNDSTELKVIVYRHKAPKVEITKSDGSNYTSGTWTNQVTIKLSTNDDFFAKSNTNVSNFQMKIDNGAWQNVNCKTKTATTCTMSITKNTQSKYSFRIITNENRLSDETSQYNIWVDASDPSAKITPNSGTPIIRSGKEKGTIAVTVKVSDTGNSGIKSRKYSINTYVKNPPSSGFVSFNTDTINISEDYSGAKYYVWIEVEDNAGNIYQGRSNAFTMTHEVKFDANGGTLEGEDTYYVAHSDPLNLSTIKPTREGYKFRGWNDNKNSTSVIYSASGYYHALSSKVLYAVWQAENVKVTFNANGGSVTPAEQTIPINSNIQLPNIYRDGYTFTGWYTESDGVNKVGSALSSYKVTGNTTLYAHWLKAECRPVESTWGNTSKYGSIEVTASGQNINKLYYKKANASTYFSAVNNPVKYLNRSYYEFMYYVENSLGSTTAPGYCYSKFDNLKPYTPHVRLGSLYSDAELLEDSCTSASRTSIQDITCTIKIKGDDHATISRVVEFTDQPSTEMSGMSGVQYKKIEYIYTDGTSCVELINWSDPEKYETCKYSYTSIYSSIDYAGNESSKLTFSFRKISA